MEWVEHKGREKIYFAYLCFHLADIFISFSNWCHSLRPVKNNNNSNNIKIGEKVAKLLKYKRALEARFAAPFGIKLINDNCSGAAAAFEKNSDSVN